MDDNQVRTIVQEILQEHSFIFWKELLIAALDSPVVILALVAIILWKLRDKLFNMLSTRNIEIGWGDKSIKLNELSNNLDQEIDPIKEQIEELKLQLQNLKKPQKAQSETEQGAPKPSNEEIKIMINKALASPKFRWRSLDSIAKFSQASPEEVLEILAADDTIVISKGKRGETLAKFKHR